MQFSSSVCLAAAAARELRVLGRLVYSSVCTFSHCRLDLALDCIHLTDVVLDSHACEAAARGQPAHFLCLLEVGPQMLLLQSAEMQQTLGRAHPVVQIQPFGDQFPGVRSVGTDQQIFECLGRSMGFIVV